ncbi:helicase [Aureococcus anophagefferens]|nr:helicase [Aureococcus anophagefferens]
MPRVEYAASGRAKCRGCSMAIGNGTVRVGDEAEGDWGPYMRWFHLGCYGFRSGASATTISGYGRLRHADGRRLGAAAVDGSGRRAVGEQYREDTAFYGECGVMIVGCQYYGGVIHRGEMANLVREPANPYDGNAVRVDNLAGDQVGHLKRVFAAALAPLVDDPSPAAVAVEAVVPQAPSSMYQAPSQGPRAPSNVVRSVEAAARQTQKELDAVYDSMAAALEKMDAAPFAAALQGALATELLRTSSRPSPSWPRASRATTSRTRPRPSAAAAKTPPLPPLWEARNEKQRAVYFNSATNTSQPQRPAAVRGGLLADDMGLGKTLSILALVVARDAALLAGSAPPPAPAAEWDEDAEFKRAKKLKVGELRSALEGLGRETAGLKGALVGATSSSTTAATAARDAAAYDVVVTSYGVLVAEAPDDASKKRKLSGLYTASWRRVVLDEAHTIRNPRTKTAKAVARLDRVHSWCVTGTPMVNKVEDFQAVFSFVRCAPVDDPRSSRAVAPIKEGVGPRAAPAARHERDPAAVEEAPRGDAAAAEDGDPLRRPRRRPRRLRGSPTARCAVEGLGDDALKSYSSILECLLRLRQVCAGGASLVPAPRLAAARAALQSVGGGGRALTKDAADKLLAKLREALSQDQAASDEGTFECAVCLDDVPAARAKLLSGCGHHFCDVCSEKLATSYASSGCPLCRAPFVKADLVSPSEASAAAAAPVVVFSQFVGVLANAKAALDDAEVDARLLRSLSAARALLADFAGDGGPRVLLVSLKCGGTGLNLTRANHVFLLDTWWNAAVEEQAMDRVHRLGQTRPVTAVRLVADRTVESRILDIQQAKTLVSAGARRRRARAEPARAEDYARCAAETATGALKPQTIARVLSFCPSAPPASPAALALRRVVAGALGAARAPRGDAAAALAARRSAAEAECLPSSRLETATVPVGGASASCAALRDRMAAAARRAARRPTDCEFRVLDAAAPSSAAAASRERGASAREVALATLRGEIDRLKSSVSTARQESDSAKCRGGGSDERLKGERDAAKEAGELEVERLREEAAVLKRETERRDGELEALSGLEGGRGGEAAAGRADGLRFLDFELEFGLSEAQLLGLAPLPEDVAPPPPPQHRSRSIAEPGTPTRKTRSQSPTRVMPLVALDDVGDDASSPRTANTRTPPGLDELEDSLAALTSALTPNTARAVLDGMEGELASIC